MRWDAFKSMEQGSFVKLNELKRNIAQNKHKNSRWKNTRDDLNTVGIIAHMNSALNLN